MSQANEAQPKGVPGSAYVALLLGVAAVAAIPFQPLAAIVGAVALASAFYARRIIRSRGLSPGTVPSLLGAILGGLGVLSALPWVMAVLFSVFA